MSFLKFIRNLIPHYIVNLFYHLPISILATIFYHYPARNLVVIGVTGTDGKTTTSTLIYEILRKAAKKVALITSVCAKIGRKNLDTGLHVTTPDAWELQKLLRYIADKKFKFVVLESTSHGLAQYRLWGCNFQIGVLTNVTHEHLDYHGSWFQYLKDKARLFKKTKYSVLNRDDGSYSYLKDKAGGKVITYGLKKADFTPEKFTFKTLLPGDYNQYNCLAAIAVSKILEINNKDIKKAITSFKGVPGRMEEVLSKPLKIIVDFAHTPNGLENALRTLRAVEHKRLIAVFGCAGLRDKEKRPKMGKIACRLADIVVLTAEDPRTEDVKEIIGQIEKGCEKKGKIYKEPDRGKAIALAISLAKEGDVVGIFGKGHEKSMCFGTKEYPWLDKKAIEKVLRSKKISF